MLLRRRKKAFRLNLVPSPGRGEEAPKRALPVEVVGEVGISHFLGCTIGIGHAFHVFGGVHSRIGAGIL
jgi:hypothetical protein